MSVENQMKVTISSAQALKLLWLVQLSKGALSVETPRPLPRHSRIRILLVLPGVEIALEATTIRCVSRVGHGFFANLALDNLAEPQRAAIEKLIFVTGPDRVGAALAR
jgi:hypothetical protein